MWPTVMYQLGLRVKGQGAIEIIIRPGSEHVQLCIIEDAQAYLRETGAAARIIAVFTNCSETQAALHLAQILAPSPDIHIVLVCPVLVPSLFGPIRIQRFVDFARKRSDALPARAQEKLHSVVWPLRQEQEVIEQLSSARSVVLVRRRWWRQFGRSIPEAQYMKVNTISLIL